MNTNDELIRYKKRLIDSPLTMCLLGYGGLLILRYSHKLNQSFVLVYGLKKTNAIRHRDKQDVTWKGNNLQEGTRYFC